MDTQNMNNETNEEVVETTETQSSSSYVDNTNTYVDNTTTYAASSNYQEPAEPSNKANGLSIAGLVLGIVSIVFCCCSYIGAIFGIVGLICSILGKKKNPNGIATAGMVCSIIGIVLGLGMFVVNLIIIQRAGGSEAYMNQLLEQMQQGNM